MALALDLVQKIDISGRRRYLLYKATPSGTYTTNGDTIDFTAATNTSGSDHPIPDVIPTDDHVIIDGVKGGYAADFVAGTTLKNAKLKVYSGSNTQITGGSAYPASLTLIYFTVSERMSSGLG